MNIITIFSGIVTIAKAIPQLKSMFDKFVDLWINWKIDNIENEYDTKRKKQKVLLQKIKEAKTNEERKVLSVILADIDKL